MRVVILCGSTGKDGVAVREGEDDVIVALHGAESLDTLVAVLQGGRVALFPGTGHRIVDERHRKRCLRQLRAVGRLADEKIVTGQQGTLHRGGRDLEGLEKEDVDEGHDDDGEENGIQPTQRHLQAAALLSKLVQPGFQTAGHTELVNHRQAEQPPVIPVPDDPAYPQHGPDDEPYPGFPVRCSPDVQGKELFDRVDDSFESLRIVHRQVGEDLAVEPHVLLRETAHELGIVHTVLTGGGVDAGNPK